MADISKITTLNGTTYNLKDTTARSIASSAYTRPMYGLGTGDIAMRSLVPEARANRLCFLPADQIIIESTTDGGAIWASANISDAAKTQLFSGTRPNITLPRINGARSTSCGMRVTFSAMKYNVPSGTDETAKYNYWNSTYINKQERYTSLTEFWFWLGTNGDTFRVVVEAATGAASTTWVKCFDTNDYSIGFTGWSGADWCRFVSKTFGGSTNQTSNYWNWRITFWSRYAEGKSDFQQTSTQNIYHIAGYGENYWGVTNNLMKNDHLYSFDYQQNATFPAKVTATGGFSGALTGNVTGNVSGTAANVTGTVAIANGGTGKTTAKDAANNLLTGLPEWTADPSDNVYLIRQDTGGSNLFGRVKFSTVWNYISGKISSVLGLTASTYGGSAAQVNGHTVAKDVPSNAVFTDTTYGLVTPSTPGLMSAADKNKLDSIITSNANSPIIMIETSAFSSLPVTITSDRITANHYLLESTLSNPSAQAGDWTVTTSNGSLTISGTTSGTTSAVLILGRVDEESATMLVFDISSFSSLPVTVTDSRITAYHYVLHTEVGNPQAQISDWTVTTGSGTMSITGSISGSSTLRVILGTAGSL